MISMNFLPVIRAELENHKIPLPPEYIDALIGAESGGNVGQVNPSSGASGLMQIMPIALKEYNQRNKTNLKMSDMRGTDAASLKYQIRVGAYLLGMFWKGAYSYLHSRLSTVRMEDLAKIAQMFYVAGPNAAKKMLEPIEKPIYQNFLAANPDWKSRHYIDKIWKTAEKNGAAWDVPAIEAFVHGQIEPAGISQQPLIASVVPNTSDAKKSIALAILILAVAAYLLEQNLEGGLQES